jgi:hypothetical protein
MTDVYAATGMFGNPRQLAADLARTLMRIEGVPDIPMFRGTRRVRPTLHGAAVLLDA